MKLESLNDLLKGKGTIIKKNEYLSTEQFVTPFLDRMSQYTNDFRVEVRLPDQLTTVNNDADITYNRVWIQAVLPNEYAFNNHQEVVGLVYGLDVRTPVAKIYTGALNMACTNLCVFNPGFLNIQEIEPLAPINFNCVTELMEKQNDIRETLTNLSNTEFLCSDYNINESLGKWIRNSMKAHTSLTKYNKVKMSASDVISAYKLLFEKDDSPYFVGNEDVTNMFNVYNAFTQIITDDDKDIMNKFEKTLVVKEILGF